MIYTIGEMAKRLDVAPSTLRYYDKEGLLPFVERTDGGIRVFKDNDYEWLQVIKCLKQTGMKLADIKSFVEMAIEGDKTIDARLDLIVKQKDEVERQIRTLEQTLEILNFKEWYYRTAKKSGTTKVPGSMTLDELPEQFRQAHVKLRGE